MKVDDLLYELPPELIAQQPLPSRSASRLLVVNRGSGTCRDAGFSDLPKVLDPNDVLVLNDTRVLPAKFMLRRRTGGRIEGLWLGGLADGDWQVLLQGASRVRCGETLYFESAPQRYAVGIVERGERGLFRLRVTPPTDAAAVLQEVGRSPLPHYIRRETGNDEDDARRYQTVYAREPGAVAAPTAGLHFDDPLLDRLRSVGIEIITVTLHVGPGTFRPVECSDLQDHVLHAERYIVDQAQWEKLARFREQRRRIVAVGTTSARVLETVARGGPLAGETDLFIYPPYRFQMVDVMITNFHLPRSTLLAMIYAFGGIDLIRNVYQHAIRQMYRFYSYGDAMLIE